MCHWSKTSLGKTGNTWFFALNSHSQFFFANVHSQFWCTKRLCSFCAEEFLNSCLQNLCSWNNLFFKRFHFYKVNFVNSQFKVLRLLHFAVRCVNCVNLQFKMWIMSKHFSVWTVWIQMYNCEFIVWGVHNYESLFKVTFAEQRSVTPWFKLWICILIVNPDNLQLKTIDIIVCDSNLNLTVKFEF